jgi:hypothetical protein
VRPGDVFQAQFAHLGAVSAWFSQVQAVVS